MRFTRDIPAASVGDLIIAVRRIARRSERLGLPAPTVEIGDLFEIVTDTGDGYATVQTRVTVTVTGEAPTLDGWTMRAVIHRELPPNGDAPHLVHAVDGQIELAWRTLPDRCDHCGLDGKGRKTLMVLRHTDGTCKIVGSTCLADFLGGTLSPQDAVAALAIVDDFAELFDEEDGFGREQCGQGEVRLKLDRLLILTACEIRHNGWLSISKASEEGGLSTKERVMLRIARPADDHPDVLPEDQLTALAAIAWAASLDPMDGDYIANIQALAVRETVTDRQTGMACSIVGAFLRHVGEQAAKDVQSSSVHVGQVGKRDLFAGTVAAAFAVDSRFGVAVWLTVVDAVGNVLRWRCSGGRAPKVGDMIAGKATVKAHDIWQDTAQTVLTRWAWELA